MAAIAYGVKNLFAFKYKQRDDDFSDQYNRIFMTKAMLVATFITGMQWYSDDVSCTVPANLAGNAVILSFFGFFEWESFETLNDAPHKHHVTRRHHCYMIKTSTKGVVGVTGIVLLVIFSCFYVSDN